MKLLSTQPGWSDRTNSILPVFFSAGMGENVTSALEIGYFKRFTADVIKLYFPAIGGGSTNGDKKGISCVGLDHTVLYTTTLDQIYPFNDGNANRFAIMDISTVPVGQAFYLRFEDNDDNSLSQQWAWMGFSPCGFMYSEV